MNSVRMEAERQIGKTSILHKMEAQPPPGWETVSLDLEQVHSATEFAERVCVKIRARLTGWKKQGLRIRSFLESLRGTQVGPMKFPEKTARPEGYWKTLLNHAVEDLVEQQHAAGKRVVFLFDEMPWMLTAIADPRRDGAPKLRWKCWTCCEACVNRRPLARASEWCCAESVGMHHILAELRCSGYRNQPVNDMMLIEVPPLEADVAAEARHPDDCRRRTAAGSGRASRIAEVTGGFPFYIHWLVSRLSTEGRSATQTEIDDAVKWLLTADHDPRDLRHFLKRIRSYYPGVEKIVLAILGYAANQAHLTQADLINVGKGAGTSEDEQIRELLRQLAMDHYLSKGTDGRIGLGQPCSAGGGLLNGGLNDG